VANVFVTMEQAQIGGRTIDISPAEQYGKIIQVIPQSYDSPYSTESMVHRAMQVLRRFNSTTDYILPMGSPMSMFVVGMVLGRLNIERCNVLRWERRAFKYVVQDVDLRKSIDKLMEDPFRG